MKRTLADASRHCHRLIAMPNLRRPLVSLELIEEYHQTLRAAMPSGRKCEPLIPLYLTDDVSAEEIARVAKSPLSCGAKLYPSGATTHSIQGVARPEKMESILEAMQEHDLPLLLHAEVPDAKLDIFDREAAFIERFAQPWSERFPALRIVVEHISTALAADFVRSARAGVAATITAHHLLLTRNDLLADGLHPHLYCMPVVKRESDRQAVLAAATSGNQRFFMGSDSAPHARTQKESAQGCAGIYTAHAALALYAEAFEQAGALDKLRAFACENGARFYRMPLNQMSEGQLVLSKQAEKMPAQLAYPHGELVPFRAGSTVAWRCEAHK